MASLDTIVKRFQSTDRATRLDMLLDLSDRLPPLPDRFRLARDRGLNQVTECQTPVFLYAEAKEGRFELHADVPREAPTVRGFVALLIKGLTGAKPEEAAAIPDDLLDRLRLTETLGMTRMQGLSAVVQRVKRMAQNVSSQT